MFENYRKHPWNYFNKLFPQLAWMDGKDLHRFYNFDERGILGGQIYTPPPHGHNKKKCFGAVLVDKFLIACSLLQVLLSEKSFPVNAGKLFLGVRLGK